MELMVNVMGHYFPITNNFIAFFIYFNRTFFLFNKINL